ncbi:MAG: arsenite S-adenosylmethyltransferase, partial [Candidatus Latescibacterota bacterium]
MDVKKEVKDRYAKAARQVIEKVKGEHKENAPSCCSSGVGEGTDASAIAQRAITGDLYGADELAGVPADAALASLGCGNPTALAELAPGEVVLDLGA